MLKFVKPVFFSLSLIMALTSCSYKEQASQQNFAKGIMSATILYISNDSMFIDFQDLEQNKYNEMLFTNILTKATFYKMHAEADSSFELNELSLSLINGLCLASVFMENYPHKAFNQPQLEEVKQYFISIRPQLLVKLNGANLESNCVDIHENFQKKK